MDKLLLICCSSCSCSSCSCCSSSSWDTWQANPMYIQGNTVTNRPDIARAVLKRILNLKHSCEIHFFAGFWEYVKQEGRCLLHNGEPRRRVSGRAAIFRWKTVSNRLYPMTKTQFMQKRGVRKCAIITWLPWYFLQKARIHAHAEIAHFPTRCLIQACSLVLPRP